MELNNDMRNALLEQLIENDNLEQHREHMICKILEWQVQDNFTREELLKKSTMDLEDIYINVK